MYNSYIRSRHTRETEMKNYSKSRIAAWLFDDKASIKVGSKIIVRGQVDGKRIYHLESRDISGHLIQSNSYQSISALKGAL